VNCEAVFIAIMLEPVYIIKSVIFKKGLNIVKVLVRNNR